MNLLAGWEPKAGVAEPKPPGVDVIPGVTDPNASILINYKYRQQKLSAYFVIFQIQMH